uniref:Anaphase-promoting complex subunit 4 WD40 domain-containing protein n=1 Tax=Oryza punctata TaxID=4537 RepID=A0A0E0LPL3_ORYPU
MTPTTPFAVAVAVADAGEIPPPLVHLGFNLYSTGFVAATATGLRVFSCFNSPLKKVLARDVEVCPEDDCGGSSSSSQGGWKVAIVEMFNEAFAAVVFRREKDDGSGGTVDKICFWSIPNGRMYCMHKTLPFDVVRGVRLVGEYLLVAGDERAVLYELPHAGAPPKKVKVVETAANPLGLGAVVQPDGNARFVLVAPQKMKGMLQVHRLAEDHGYVRAHYSSVAAMALSVDGRLLATAGSKGTLVRIFSTSDGKLLQVTFKLRALHEESGVTAAAGDMHDRDQSTCAVVRRVAPGADARFEVKRFRPGSLNYNSRYDSVRIGMDAGDDDEVRSVHVHGDRTVVVHAGRVDVFGLDGRKATVLQRRVETGDNQLGICAVSRGPESPFAFACPGVNDGDLRVERWVGEFMPLVIDAHRSRVASVAMSWDAKLVATASVRGTVVRVFRVADGTLLQEMRRGSDRADIYSIAFSTDSEWLAVSSDKGTVHVFRINICLTTSSKAAGQYATQSYGAKAIKKSISSIKDIFTLGYFDPERSVAQFRLRENVKYFVTFGKIPNKNIVLIIGMDGSFYRCQFDPANGGEMKQLEYMNFLNM